MEQNLLSRFGVNLHQARLKAGLTQAELASQCGLKRLSVFRLEGGKVEPRLDVALRLAAALKISLQQLLTGKPRLAIGLKGIAFELYQLGVWDYVVEGATVPGAFRRPEQVVALALRGNRPETRLVDAMPMVLARNPLDVGLALAFASHHDRRVRVRLAWLSDVTLALARLSTFPVPLQDQAGLEKLVKRVKKPRKADEPDSLGLPGPGPHGPLWRRWNISYGGTMDGFLRRTRELAESRPSGATE